MEDFESASELLERLRKNEDVLNEYRRFFRETSGLRRIYRRAYGEARLMRSYGHDDSWFLEIADNDYWRPIPNATKKEDVEHNLKRIAMIVAIA